METTETLTIDAAQALLEDALKANGVPPTAALSVAHALVAAEAEGQVGHGFSRLEDYIAQVRTGKIVADAEITVTHPSPTTVMVDAGYGFAFPALDTGIGEGMTVAETEGAATVCISRSHHCGALSVQVDRIARQGLVALMVANSPVAIAPWGAKTPIFGTNPIAFAAPRAGHAPLVIDLSLSRVARGKVLNAQKAGKPIPPDWALDSEGQPTTDPSAALKGSMQPIGGPKGTALALMVEILSTVMTGANLSVDAGSFFTADGTRPGVGQFLTIYRPPGGAEAFTGRLETLLGLIEALDGARLPGARRLDALARAREEGITVPARYLEVARRLAGTGA